MIWATEETARKACLAKDNALFVVFSVNSTSISFNLKFNSVETRQFLCQVWKLREAAKNERDISDVELNSFKS